MNELHKFLNRGLQGQNLEKTRFKTDSHSRPDGKISRPAMFQCPVNQDDEVEVYPITHFLLSKVFHTFHVDSQNRTKGIVVA